MPRIDAIELNRVCMPLISPFRTAYGSDDAIESVLVKMTSADCCGWGEASPLKAPTYSPEFAAGVFLVMREFLAPVLVGQDIASGENLQKRLAGFKGNYFAKGGLDMAWWDLQARRRGQPLWKLLGGCNQVVDVGADFGVLDSIDTLLEHVHAAAKAGFKRVKLKYAPGWALEMVAAVRKAFPNTVFHIDCNSAYTLDDLPMFRELDGYDLAMIEQPLAHDDLIDHAKLQAAIRTPICLDESISSLDKARKAIALKACRWINLKPARAGGLTNALKIHDLCAEAGIGCWVGGMLESGLGAGHCLALATLPNIKYPSDIFPTSRFYQKDLALPEITLCGPSQIAAPYRPGLGFDPDPQQLAKLTVDRATLSA